MSTFDTRRGTSGIRPRLRPDGASGRLSQAVIAAGLLLITLPSPAGAQSSCGAATANLSPAGLNFSSAGGTGSFDLTFTDPSCFFFTQVIQSDLIVDPDETQPEFGTGNTSLTFQVSANPGATARTAQIRIEVSQSNEQLDQVLILEVTQAAPCRAIIVAPASLTGATIGQAYSQALSQTGGTAPVTFAATGLPAGLSVVNGVITGTPTVTGTFTVTVTATDANGCTGMRAYTLIVSCATLTIAPGSLPDAVVGQAYSQALSQTGGTAPVTFAAAGLPAGLSVLNGVITGTPAVTGTFAVTVTATDANGCTGAAAYTLVVGCPPIAVGPDSLAAGNAGTPYPPVTFTQTGGTVPVTFTFTGALPAGMTLASGVLSGTPTEAGTFGFTVIATDANQCSGSRSYSLSTEGDLTLLKAGTGDGTVSSQQVTGADDCPGCDPNRIAAGLMFRLTAVPRADSSFARWTGHPDCADGLVTITGNMVCEALFVRLPLDPALDLNGDCRADVFLYDAASGAWSREIGRVEGGFLPEGSGTWSPHWIVRAANWNGDEARDFLLYQQQTGTWAKATNDGLGGFRYFTATWAPGWQVFVVDLNGDGLSDVLLYNPATGLAFQATNIGPGEFAYVQADWGRDWEVYPAQFNHDHRADLFLHNKATGRYLKAINDGAGGYTCGSSGQPCFGPGAVPATWSPGWDVYLADLSGDHLSDVFLYNPTTGGWFIASATEAGFALTQGLWSPGWTIRPAEFDDDGRRDLFLYNPANGLWFIALSDGAGGFVYYSGRWDPGWRVFVTDYYFDRRSDLLLYNDATGIWAQMRNAGPGRFEPLAGVWKPGLEVVAELGAPAAH